MTRRRLGKSIKPILIGIVFIIGGYLLLTKYIPQYLMSDMMFTNPLGTIFGSQLLIYVSYGLILIGAYLFIKELI